MELVAFAARLGEKFDDSKLREAFITADFVEAETKRQEELCRSRYMVILVMEFQFLHPSLPLDGFFLP